MQTVERRSSNLLPCIPGSPSSCGGYPELGPRPTSVPGRSLIAHWVGPPGLDRPGTRPSAATFVASMGDQARWRGTFLATMTRHRALRGGQCSCDAWVRSLRCPSTIARGEEGPSLDTWGPNVRWMDIERTIPRAWKLRSSPTSLGCPTWEASRATLVAIKFRDPRCLPRPSRQSIPFRVDARVGLVPLMDARPSRTVIARLCNSHVDGRWAASAL